MNMVKLSDYNDNLREIRDEFLSKEQTSYLTGVNLSFWGGRYTVKAIAIRSCGYGRSRRGTKRVAVNNGEFDADQLIAKVTEIVNENKRRREENQRWADIYKQQNEITSEFFAEFDLSEIEQELTSLRFGHEKGDELNYEYVDFTMDSALTAGKSQRVRVDVDEFGTFLEEYRTMVEEYEAIKQDFFDRMDKQKSVMIF